MAAESLLENESLRAGLEEGGAAALLRWGVACAKRIAAEHASLEDNEAYEEACYPQMRALRRMLDRVNSLYRPGMLPAARRALLVEIADLAAVAYGPGAHTPQRIYWSRFLATLDEPGERIDNLRKLIEQNLNSEGE
jgi:hypothetical protein